MEIIRAYIGLKRIISAALLIVVASSVVACQSLTVHDSDSRVETSGKVVGRTILGLSTLGMSEVSLHIYNARMLRVEDCYGTGTAGDVSHPPKSYSVYRRIGIDLCPV